MPEDELIPESIAPEAETPEESVIRLGALNKKLFARAKKAEGFTQDSTTGEWVKKVVEPAKPIIIEERKEPAKPSDILKSDEFRLHRMGYNENEIDLIMHNGGAKALEDKTSPLVLGLEASGRQRRAEEAAAKAEGASGLSDIERKYTEADMRNMPKEELAKLIPHANK